MGNKRIKQALLQKDPGALFFAILSLPATGVGFALSTQVAVLSWILNTRYALHIEDVALVWLAGPLSGIIAQPLIGAISDKSWFWGGRRKPFIIAGGVLGMLMLLGLLHLDTISTWMGLDTVFAVAVTVALLLDISVNVTFNPARAIIADVTPAGMVRVKAYSWMQVISGTFSLGAYFISLVFGNVVLLYTAAALVFLFSILPWLMIREPETLASVPPTEVYVADKVSFVANLRILLPLYGFIIFGLFVILDKTLLSNRWASAETAVMYGCLLLTLFTGAWIVLKGRKSVTDENELQKIMLAHAFSWLGIQSMFVMSLFYIQQKIMPGLESSIAEKFSQFFTGKIPQEKNTAGNILSMGFFILNLVGALLPVLVLEPLSRMIGRVTTYRCAIGAMMFGFLFLYVFGETEINFYLGMMICGIGWSAVISIVFAIMSERVKTGSMGLSMGLFNYSIVMPAMMTVGISKIVADTGNYALLFLIAAISLLLSFLCWLFVKEP